MARARIHEVADAMVVARQDETDAVLENQEYEHADEEYVEDVSDALAASTTRRGALRRVEHHSEGGSSTSSGFVSIRFP